jgi:hypothetical protein
MMPDRIRQLFTRRYAGLWVFLGAALVVVVALAVFASPFASRSPDGLDKTAEQEGIADRAQEHETPLAGYTVPGVKGEKTSTGLAGLIGVLVTLAVALAVGAVMFLVAQRRGNVSVNGTVSPSPPAQSPPH